MPSLRFPRIALVSIGALTMILTAGCGRQTAQAPAPAVQPPVTAPTSAPTAPTDQTPLASAQDESNNPYDVFRGKQAPDFATTTTEGKPLSLQSLRGKVVLLDYWATWCGPCKMAMPTLEALHKSLSPQGLRVVGISVDTPETISDVPAVSRQLGVTYTLAASPEQDAKAAGKYNISGIPAQFLIDKNGVVRWTSNGFAPSEVQLLTVLIRKLLAEPA